MGVLSQVLNKLVLNNNLFSGNGPATHNASAAVNIGNGFNPALLGPLAADAAANLGNYTGYPAFVAPRDPRPGSDGPATFLLDANFGLLSTSAAINNALDSVATRTDFLGNPANPNPTTAGFHLPGYGPRDVGAFEFEPIGTPGHRGGRRCLPRGDHLAGAQWRPQANGSTLYVSPAPNTVIVDFSNPVNEATVKATDLVLSGSDINPLSPVKAMSVTWLDNHTAQFNLTGQFNPLGTVNVSLVPGDQEISGQALPDYAD